MCEAFSSGKFKPLLAVWAACLVDFRPSSNHRPSSRSPTVERTDEHRRRVPEASARVSSVGEARTRTADEEVCVIELRSAAALALASAFFGVGWNVGLTRPVRKTLQGAGVLEISDHHTPNAVLIRDENIASKIATPAPDGGAAAAVAVWGDEIGEDGGSVGGGDGGGETNGGDDDDTEGARPARARAEPDRFTSSPVAATRGGGGRSGGGGRGGGGKKRKLPPRPQRLGTVGVANPTGLRLTYTRFKPETTGTLAVQVGWLTDTGARLSEMGELPLPVAESDEADEE